MRTGLRLALIKSLAALTSTEHPVLVRLSNWIATPKLVRTTLLNMGLRVALVVLISASFSYWYLGQQTEYLVQEQLSRYVSERGRREAEVFRLAVDRHQILKQVLQSDEKSSASPKLKLYAWKDGSQRNIPDGFPLENFDGNQRASIFLGPTPAGQPPRLTSELRQRLARFEQLVLQYGPAWRDRFINIYLLAPENAAVLYWPEVPGPLMVPGEFDIHHEPFFYLSERDHNEDRTTAWTQVYHDPASPDWIVSVVTPVDNAQGQHIATIGHDIILTELMERASQERLQGSENIIFSASGQLIVHPEFGPQIQAKNGELRIQDLNNPHLDRIFEQVSSIESPAQPLAESAVAESAMTKGAMTESAIPQGAMAQAPTVLDNHTDNEFLAVVNLGQPDWYFVTVYPKALMNQEAIAAVRFVLLSGLLSLAIEMTLLYNVLNRQVAHPLGKLVEATEQIAAGDFALQLESEREDEIGQLSRAFTAMVVQLQDIFSTLDTRIQERTAQLEQANEELERLSRLDSLTQVANRRCFDDHLHQEWQRQQREQQPISIILCDVDFFKNYNDHYGHPAGDVCLQQVAQALKAVAKRPADLVARYGGEEFALILPETDATGAEAIAQQVCEQIRMLKIPHEGSMSSSWVTISAGVSTRVMGSSTASPQTPEALVAAADAALYGAKQGGRDRYCLSPRCETD